MQKLDTAFYRCHTFSDCHLCLYLVTRPTSVCRVVLESIVTNGLFNCSLYRLLVLSVALFGQNTTSCIALLYTLAVVMIVRCEG